MRNFKFLQENFRISEEERAILLREFLGDNQDEDAIEPDVNTRREVVFVPSETTQIYTQIIRVELPFNQVTEDHLNQLKISNENMLFNQISDTLDIRHEIIYQDENGFTLRSELFL
jgi:hypothetical protein